MKSGMLRSLAVQITLFFALISCLVVSGLGLYLYTSAKHALEVRADYTLVSRVDRFRNLLHDLYNVKQMEKRPAIFESMLGNERDVRIFQRVGEKPFIHINPDHMVPPPMEPVPVGHNLTIHSLHSGTRADGIRVRWVSALAEVGDHGGVVKITAAYVMTQESKMLAAYRFRVIESIILAVFLSTLMGYLLLKRGLRPLDTMSRRAEQITPSNLAVRLSDDNVPAELHQLATSCNAMLDRLEAGYEHLSQFSSDLAHEIRTPVNILMGQTQVALGRPRNQADYERLLESNLEELTHLTRIIENILFLSRTDHNTEVVEREPLVLSEELWKTADYFEGLAQERNMHFDVLASGIGRADTIMYRRAVNNLVINAIRYGDPGTSIRLEAQSNESGFVVTVENRCQPLSQAEVARMFRRFYRGDKSRSRHTESSGLGLAIVSAIMTIHGGNVDAHALETGGLRISLRFPH